MNCLACLQETVHNAWGEWCDRCGGVVTGSTKDPKLFFRHVATADGPGGRFPVVYDISSESYGVAWPKPSRETRCVHCGRLTPVDAKSGLSNLDDMRQPAFYSSRGSLDAILAIALQKARGDSIEVPEISGAFSSTPEERQIMGLNA